MNHAILLPLLAAVAGFGCGLCYFAAVRQTATRLVVQHDWLGCSALTLGRLVAVAAGLAAAAHLGALTLLASFAGFLLARGFALRPSRRTA